MKEQTTELVFKSTDYEKIIRLKNLFTENNIIFSEKPSGSGVVDSISKMLVYNKASFGLSRDREYCLYVTKEDYEKAVSIISKNAIA